MRFINFGHLDEMAWRSSDYKLWELNVNKRYSVSNCHNLSTNKNNQRKNRFDFYLPFTRAEYFSWRVRILNNLFSGFWSLNFWLFFFLFHFHRRMALQALSHICSGLPDSITLDDEFVGSWIYDVITDIGLSLDRTFSQCSWQNENVTCSEIFVPLLTDDGLCFSFNALNSREFYTKEYELYDTFCVQCFTQFFPIFRVTSFIEWLTKWRQWKTGQAYQVGVWKMDTMVKWCKTNIQSAHSTREISQAYSFIWTLWRMI